MLNTITLMIIGWVGFNILFILVWANMKCLEKKRLASLER